MTEKRWVTLVSTGDLEYIYGVAPIVAKKWRNPKRSSAGGEPRSPQQPLGPRVYDPQAAASSILGERYARVSARDVYDLDVVVERIRARTGREPDEARVAEVRDRATVPADAVVAGYAEVGELLDWDQRYVSTLDQRDGKLPAPIALIGPPGQRREVRVYATSQFAGHERYSQQRARALAKRHREGP